jgi:hypothetical protein
MNEIHDIRDQMPKFSANFFKPYVHQDYPRMMVNRTTGKPYLDGAKKPIAVDSVEAEITFWASKGIKANAVKNNGRIDMVFEAGEAAPVIEAAKAIEIPIAAVAPPIARQVFEALTPKQAEKVETRLKRKYTRKLPADLK